jgi:hypothetical protein
MPFFDLKIDCVENFQSQQSKSNPAIINSNKEENPQIHPAGELKVPNLYPLFYPANKRTHPFIVRIKSGC